MKLTQETIYGTKLVECLANLKKGKIANAGDISKETGVTTKFTLKILNKLGREGIVESYRGVAGGYELKKEEVNVYEVIEALQGDLYIANEFKEKNEPENEIGIELKKIQEDVIKRLKNMKLKKKN